MSSDEGQKPKLKLLDGGGRPEPIEGSRRVLFSFSGGGMRGACIHAGILAALQIRGIESTHNAGNSAGAFVAALDCFSEPGYIEKRLRELRDADVRDDRTFWKLRFPWLQSICAGKKLRALVEAELPPEFSDLPKPLTVTVTQVRDGRVAYINRDVPLPTAVLASMSISGFFPHVEIGGSPYADGGVRANLPLPHDWDTFDQVWFLIASPPTSYRTRGSILGNLLLNLDWLRLDQIDDVLCQVRARVKELQRDGRRAPAVHVIWGTVGQDVGSMHFEPALIEQSREWTLKAIEKGLDRL